ncbi:MULTISPECIES: hypothetical protein [Gimesia]|jgi:hypothetical protein|uniref:hypothetical protein n=1 Tax=Gimesia TaxID=1649453 RepID=UPI0012D2B8C1|nr:MULTISPECIES: hypothetical protein [Gimesia]MCR9234674.1 hypothetical protein [bacterium]
MAHAIKIGLTGHDLPAESAETIRIAATALRLFLEKRFLINASVVIDKSIF